MIIFALDSADSEYQKLLNQLSIFATVETFEDFDFLLETIEAEEYHALLFNRDESPRKNDKEIKKVKKLKHKQPLIIFSNQLDSKQIIKHQKSKYGAALYLQTPIDQEMLVMLIEPFWQGDELDKGGENPKTSIAPEEQKILDSHQDSQAGGLSEESEVISKKLDGAFETAFPMEYSAESKARFTPPSTLAEASKGENEDDTVDELQPLSEIDLNLDEDENSEEEIVNFPNEEDLTFPELDISDMNESEAEPLESSEEDEEDWSLEFEDEPAEDSQESSEATQDEGDLVLELSEEEVESLDIGDDQDEEAQSFSPDEGLELDLEGDDEPLVLGDEEDELTEQNAEVDNGLDLSLELLDEDVEEISDGAEDNLPMNSDDLPSGLDLDFSISEEVESFDLSDESIDDLGTELGDEDVDSALIASQAEIDDELTRPALDMEKLDLQFNDSLEEEKEDESPQEESPETLTSIGLDVSDDFDEGTGEESIIEGQGENTIMGVSFEEENSPVDIDSNTDDLFSETDDVAEEDEDLTAIVASPVADDFLDEELTAVQRVEHVGAETKTTITPQKSASGNVYERDEELVRLGETINVLRIDRDNLIDKITALENKEDSERRDFLNLKAQLDEKQIELTVIKKRFERQVEELKIKLDVSQDKRAFLEKRNQDFALEIEKLNKQKRLDHGRVHQRERELEERLEMLRKDSEIQLRNRDQKILELKRRIDSLEFDLESYHSKERDASTHQIDLEEKLDSVINTLRSAIGQLEDDHQVQEKRLMLKKNLKT